MFGKKKNLAPLEAETIQRIVQRAIEDAREYVETDVAPQRKQADQYFQGYSAVKAETGRSRIVVTRVRDAVKSVIPSLARVFTQSDTIAEFSSELEADEKTCIEQTLFVNQVFHKFGGYSSLIQASTDALKAKVGVIKVSLEQKPVAMHTFEDFVTPDQLQMLQSDETQTITEMTPPMPAPMDEATLAMQQQQGMGDPSQAAMMAGQGMPQPLPQQDPEDVVYGVVLTKQSFRNKWHLDPVPPESFFISRGATCVDDARVIGTAQNLEAWEAMQVLGISEEDLAAADRDPELDNEKQLRSGNTQAEADEDGADPLSREVLVCEAWLRLDEDGDGVPEIRHIITVGTGYRVISDEPTNCIPLAIFKADLQPHTFFPICMAEDLEQDQDAQTALLRSIIDNAAQVNTPRTAAVEAQVNLEDLMNPEIGAIVRTKQPGQIEELTTPFVGGQTLAVLQYMEGIAEARSGVTKMSQGLSADILQSSPKEAANAMVQGSDARIEMMARNLAETGVKDLFLCILRTAMYEMKGPQSVRTLTGFEEVRPDLWHDQVAVNVNVGLGNGRVGEKTMALSEIAQVQQSIMGMLGLDNPLAGWEQLRKTIVDKAKIAGIRNTQDYLPVVPEAVLKQISQQMQQAQAQQGQQPDPSAGLVQAETIKAQANMQIKSAELQQRGQLESAKLQQQGQIEMAQLQAKLAGDNVKAKIEDDRARDIAAGQFAVDAQTAQLDAAERARVAQEQSAPRSYGQQEVVQ
jgi:hypothetical protein